MSIEKEIEKFKNYKIQIKLSTVQELMFVIIIQHFNTKSLILLQFISYNYTKEIYMKKIVFCGGGTAGHVMPNIALIEELIRKDYEIHYIGGKGIEKTILKNYPYVIYHEIESPKLIRKLTFKNLSIPFKLLKAIAHCKNILKEIKPNLIFSKGGYLSLPVVIASKNIPVVGHESDYSMGLANKIIYKYTDKMFFSFKNVSKKYKKGEFSGSIIRKNIFNGNKEKAKQQLNITNNKKCILVIGGSTGAKSINNFILNNLESLTKEYNIIHITGKNKNTNNQHCEKCPEWRIKNYTYYPVEYVEDIENYITLADYIISRAGSNAIFEFLALKKQMILIPLPKDQSRGDQILNANYFYENGLAEVIPQNKLTIQLLNEKINLLKKNKNTYHKNMINFNSKNGTDIIINEILKY